MKRELKGGYLTHETGTKYVAKLIPMKRELKVVQAIHDIHEGSL